MGSVIKAGFNETLVVDGKKYAQGESVEIGLSAEKAQSYFGKSGIGVEDVDNFKKRAKLNKDRREKAIAEAKGVSGSEIAAEKGNNGKKKGQIDE